MVYQTGFQTLVALPYRERRNQRTGFTWHHFIYPDCAARRFGSTDKDVSERSASFIRLIFATGVK
jgi:hypothetical protein